MWGKYNNASKQEISKVMDIQLSGDSRLYTWNFKNPS